MGLSFWTEYSDFQLVLTEFARNNVDVLFVIPPINQKWMDYTGLPQEVLSVLTKDPLPVKKPGLHEYR